MIEKLKEFDPEMEVIISDGWSHKFFKGDFQIGEFDGTCDIGVGSCAHTEED